MHRGSQLLHRLFLALLVAVGIEVAWSVSASVTSESIAWRNRIRPTDVAPVRGARGILIRNPAQIMVQSDGTVLVSETPTWPSIGERLYTLDLEPVSAVGGEPWVGAADLSGSWLPDDSFNALNWRGRLIDASTKNPHGQAWYFIHDGRRNGRGYFAGYDELSRLPLGCLGTRGFSADAPPRDDWFEVDGRRLWRTSQLLRGHEITYASYANGIRIPNATTFLPEGVTFFVAGGRIWRIDLAKRTVAPSTEEQVVSFDVVIAPSDSENKRADKGARPVLPRLVARTPTKIMLLDLDGESKMAWTVPIELRPEGFRWFALDDGRAIAEWSQRQGKGPYWIQTELAWIDGEGRITRKESFELYQGRWKSPGWFDAAVALGPTLLLLVLWQDYWDPDSFAATLSYLIADNWAALAVVIGFSALLAWRAYRRQRQHSLPGAGAWALFVFLLGVPGWLAYRWHRRWPVMDACGECHRPVPRDRDTCASCGHVFAPPPRLGTEIFA